MPNGFRGEVNIRFSSLLNYLQIFETVDRTGLGAKILSRFDHLCFLCEHRLSACKISIKKKDVVT